MIAIQHQQPAINNKALAWTIGVHCLLFLLFILLRYTTQIPPPVVDNGGGLEVNLGTSDNGSGKDQPMNTKAPAPYQATVVYKNAAAKSSLPKDILQSAQPNAPEVNDNNKNKKNNTNPIVEPEHKKQKDAPAPKYLMPDQKGPGGNQADHNKPGTNEGNDKGPGDKGKPGGTPGAPDYTGNPGNGTGGIGLSPSLINRGITPSKFEAEFHEGGIVVIAVTVDRDGNIVNRRIKSSSNHDLDNLALEKLSHARFGKSTSPEPQAFGDVTIVFKTHQ